MIIFCHLAIMFNCVSFKFQLVEIFALKSRIKKKKVSIKIAIEMLFWTKIIVEPSKVFFPSVCTKEIMEKCDRRV